VWLKILLFWDLTMCTCLNTRKSGQINKHITLIYGPTHYYWRHYILGPSCNINTSDASNIPIIACIGYVIIGTHKKFTQIFKTVILIVCDIAVKSTMFPHCSIHKFTWTSPDGKTHSQIDRILIDRRQNSSILDVRSFRAADCDTDHYLVVA
jgi:hypothetical protein